MKSLVFAALTLFQQPMLDTEVRTLSNGMKIIVHEDHSIPNVAMYTFYRVGSRNEQSGSTGLAHFFEHMMFNGARKYGPGSFDKVMEANGGSNNAYTTPDLTVYQNWFPGSALETIFDLEADRIANLSFDPKVIESERGVVASERRMSVDGSNSGLLYEQLMAAAFQAHPYGWPVVGWMSDIEGWTMDDLQAFWNSGYSPANATVVIAGDVQAEDVFRLAEKHLAPIARRPLPASVRTKEPEQLGERRVTVRKFAQLPLLKIGYHVPPTASPDYFTLRLIEELLFSGESSRMYQRLVDRDRLALSVSSDYDFALDPTLFTINVEPKAGVPAERVEAAVDEELQKLQRELCPEREIQKARNLALTRLYRQIQTISGKANALGQYELFLGDHRRLAGIAGSYGAVTREDIRRVASQYFTPRNRTVATLVPESSK